MQRYAKLLCFLVSSAPFVYLCAQVLLYVNGRGNNLGADPGKEIVKFLGLWAMVLLLTTLTVTPAQRLTGIKFFPLRRMLGLFAFFYATMHFVAYCFLLLELEFAGLWADILKRPYITVGMAALLAMLPLAVTSNRYMQRKLKRNWARLHKLVYGIAILVIIHFFWQTRSDFTEPLMYSALLAVLLSYRLLSRQGGWLNSRLFNSRKESQI